MLQDGKTWKQKCEQDTYPFMNDLKQYQESHKGLKNVKGIIAHGSHDTRAYYGVSKCAKTVLTQRKMVRGKGLPVLDEQIETMNPDDNDIYKFIGVEQAIGMKTKFVFKRFKSEEENRVKMLVIL